MAKRKPMYLQAFKYALEHPAPFRDDEYLTMCMNMSAPGEVSVSQESQELRQIIKQSRHLIFGDAQSGVLDLLKKIRTQDAIPRSQFWWYPDDLGSLS